MSIESFIKKLQESESFRRFKEEMHEMSSTGGVEGYQTPRAFSPKSGAGETAFDVKTKENAEQLGYKLVGKEKKRNTEGKISKKVKLKENTNSALYTNDGDEGPIHNHKSFHKSSESYDQFKTRVAENSGFKLVNEKNVFGKKLEPLSTYKQVMGELHEGSYKVYKTDETRTVNQKINHSIKEINRSIYEIERVVGHASRLKMEMGVDQRTLWSSSHKRLHKIGERLNRISKRINELGA